MKQRFSAMVKNDLSQPPSCRKCTCCGRVLTSKTVVMLELNVFTGEFSDGNVPPGSSQGWFPFGYTCAVKIMERNPE